jgi:hypothetical protein
VEGGGGERRKCLSAKAALRDLHAPSWCQNRTRIKVSPQHPRGPTLGSLSQGLHANLDLDLSSMRRCQNFVQILVNETQSRTFLSVGPSAGAEALHGLIGKVDSILLRHRLKPFYKPALPHVSLCWWDSDIHIDAERYLAKWQQLWLATNCVWTLTVGFVSVAAKKWM